MTQPIPPQVTGSDEAAAWYGNRTNVTMAENIRRAVDRTADAILGRRAPEPPVLISVPVDEYERLAAVVEAARAVRELWRHDAMAAAAVEIHTFVAAVDDLDAAPEATP